MKEIIFDIETDGLLPTVSKMWVFIAKDLNTGVKSQWLIGDMGWKEYLESADVIAGHNICGYDLPCLEKLFGWRPPKHIKIRDTLVLSQVLNYNRFPTKLHGLEAWGEFFGYPKLEHSDWTQLTPQMITYCERDVDLNAKIYPVVIKEFLDLHAKNKNIATYIKAEQAAAKWCAMASIHGWPFDLDKARELEGRLHIAMNKAYDALTKRLGMKVVAIDKKKGIVETKKPKWTMKGFYDHHTSNYFDIHPCSGYPGGERMVEGEYCRVAFELLSLDSVADVKVFLYRNGWEPTTWNFKTNPETGKKERASPKITEDSLEFLGGDGKLYTEFLTARSRYSVLKGWIEGIDENGNVHGDCMVIGTPSMRARHSGIVNVPSADAPWGREMRELFKNKPGWSVIGCDSAGNQARGLAHYLGNADFIDILLNGDIHSYNAQKLTEVLVSMGVDYVVKRGQAKRILYAFLFGASGGKLWSYIFDVTDSRKGNKLKEGFLKAVPGFKDLLDRLESIYRKTSQNGDGYIPSIAGNKIFVDSKHKLLVYLLQSCEKATCSAAIMLTMERLEEENIPYIPLIFMHDEEDFLVPDMHKERAAEIGKRAFKDGPQLFGITIMDGDAKIGNSWYEVH